MSTPDKLEEKYSHAATDDVFSEGTVDPVYLAKARILNAAIQEIGMGQYQWWVIAFW